MTDYTTATQFVEAAYVYADDYSRDTFDRRKAFYNWLRKVQADAWDEGQQTGWCEGYSHGEPEKNPYRN